MDGRREDDCGLVEQRFHYRGADGHRLWPSTGGAELARFGQATLCAHFPHQSGGDFRLYQPDSSRRQCHPCPLRPVQGKKKSHSDSFRREWKRSIDVVAEAFPPKNSELLRIFCIILELTSKLGYYKKRINKIILKTLSTITNSEKSFGITDKSHKT